MYNSLVKMSTEKHHFKLNFKFDKAELRSVDKVGLCDARTMEDRERGLNKKITRLAFLHYYKLLH